MRLSFRLAASPDRVFEILSDPDGFGRLHPLIDAIVPLGDGRYRVRERFAHLPFPLHFTYPAEITSQAASRSVEMNLRIFRLVSVDLVLRVQADGGGSLVEETGSIRSVLPVSGVLAKVLADTHRTLFDRLDARVAEEAAGAADAAAG
jgi:carbon monoxide dehydrogenase subunit G